MKKILSTFIALFACAAFGATTVPVQLLNPTGSSSGQAIVSTGASSAPAWGGVGLNGIAAIGANTVLANATGSSANPTAFAMPSCSTSSSILQYTSGTGFTCSTTIWASPPAIGGTTANSGKFTTLQATSTITPSSTAGIVGTATNDSANAGSVGEYQSSSTSNTSATTGVPLNGASFSLTAGDWDVTGICVTNPAGSTLTAVTVGGISTTSATFGSVAAGIGNFAEVTLSNAGSPTGVGSAIVAPVTRISIASTTTVFLVCQANFSTSTLTISGFIRARRVR